MRLDHSTPKQELRRLAMADLSLHPKGAVLAVHFGFLLHRVTPGSLSSLGTSLEKFQAYLQAIRELERNENMAKTTPDLGRSSARLTLWRLASVLLGL